MKLSPIVAVAGSVVFLSAAGCSDTDTAAPLTPSTAAVAGGGMGSGGENASAGAPTQIEQGGAGGVAMTGGAGQGAAGPAVGGTSAQGGGGAAAMGGGDSMGGGPPVGGSAAGGGLADPVYDGPYAEELRTVFALRELTMAPPMYDGSGATTTVVPGDKKTILYDALPYKEKPTQVYAWVSIPASASAANPVPAIVLAHGGGGEAFENWVDLWVARGYAAISMDLEGQSSPQQGPDRSGIYGDTGESLTDQWMYHSVADVILANSLMRSFPEVDATKVGLMGISWGGVITSTVIGIDSRFAFAVPTYGCGNLHDAGGRYETALQNNAMYKEVWDPMIRIDRATMPALWFSWPEDQHFSLIACAKNYGAAPGEHAVTILPGMGHGHGSGWAPPDSYAFADSVVETGSPWITQERLTLAGRAAEVVFKSTKPLIEAELVSSNSTEKFTGDWQWTQTPATVVDNGDGTWTANGTLPAGNTSGWVMNVTTDTGLVGSSDFQY